MGCKYLRIRTKKGNKYLYCILKKEIITSCFGCDDVIYKEKKSIKSYSNKRKKLENKRFSIFTNDLSKCFVCGSKYGHIDKHEVFGGTNRSNSMIFGFILPLCRVCHDKLTLNYETNLIWAKKCQKYYEDNLGTRDDFISIFHRNYL